MTKKRAQTILAIDVGGTHVKVMTEHERVKREFASGSDLSAKSMVRQVKDLTTDWTYDVISIGYPGPVGDNRPLYEPHNLGTGWKGFDFSKAFGRPTKVVNDAMMQALGSYDGGRMLFLGLGTGLGSAMIIDGVMAPMELGHLPYRKKMTFEDYVGAAGLKKLGQKNGGDVSPTLSTISLRRCNPTTSCLVAATSTRSLTCRRTRAVVITRMRSKADFASGLCQLPRRKRQTANNATASVQGS